MVQSKYNWSDNKNCLEYNLSSLQKIIISIKPTISALIDIMLFCNDDKIYFRQFLLSDQLYLDWTTDDYLPYIIKLNLQNISNNN